MICCLCKKFIGRPSGLFRQGNHQAGVPVQIPDIAIYKFHHETNHKRLAKAWFYSDICSCPCDLSLFTFRSMFSM
jgi:hypothetical protein